MVLTALFLLLEGILCKFIIRPDGSEDLVTLSLFLLVINAVVTFVGINNSINSKKIATSSEESKFFKKLNEEEGYVKTIIFLSLICRLMILMWDFFARDIFILPNSEGDAEWYHTIGVSHAFGTRANVVDFQKYVYYVGRFYRIFGVQKITAQFLNIYLAICSVVMIYKIIRRFDISSQVRKLTITIVCFLPNLMMITTFMLQESIIAFCIVSSLYFFVKWWFGEGNYNIVLAVLMSLAGSLLHMGALTIGLGITIMLVLVGNEERKVKMTPARIFAMVFAGVAALVLLVTFGDVFMGKTGGELSTETILSESNKRVEGEAVYSIGITGLPPAVDLVVNTPIRMFYFIFSPLPWMWRGLGDILGFFGSTIFYFWVAYCVIKAIKTKPLKHDDTAVIGSLLITLLVILLIAAIMFGWGVSNAGSVLRHREKFTYLFVVTFAVSNEIIYRAGKRNEPQNIGYRSRIQRKRLP